MLQTQKRRLDHVVHVAPRADLRAVAVDRQVAPRERRLDEGADRAAADLPRPEDVEGVDGHRGQAELVVVGVRHVLARELRDGVRPARLADRADRRDLAFLDVEGMRAEDLARREVDEALERRQGRDRRLEHVVGADQVHAHRAHRALEHGVDARDRRAVDDVRHALRELLHEIRVEDVALMEAQVRVLGEVGSGEGVAVQVVDRDDLVRVDEPARKRRADEPRAAGDQDPLARKSHAPSLSASDFLSRAYQGLYRRRLASDREDPAGARHARLRLAGRGCARRDLRAAGARRLAPDPWSPDSTAIVFLSTRDPETLRVVRPDGGGERPIPVSSGHWPTFTRFAFSPDWYWIAAITNSGLVVMRPDGSQRHELGGGYEPSWAPDSRRVVFQILDQIFVAKADGSERRQIVAVGAVPRWSPVGDRIAYVAPPYPNGSLQLVLPDGTGTSQIVPPGQVVPDLIRWSPDGKRIAFLTPNGANRPRRLAVVSAAGGEIRTYRTTPSEFEWAPDSRRIAVVVGTELRILDTATGASKLFARGGYDPAWSPDETQIAFAAGGVCRDRTGIYRAQVVPAPILERLTNDCHIYGTPGADVLRGTDLTDVIVGLGGNDRLTSNGGDTLEGDAGNDVLIGGYYQDILDGGSGNDVLRGGASADTLAGGPGRDAFTAGGGADLIHARDGARDLVSCGTNTEKTTAPSESDIAYVDRIDLVSADCEYVYRPGSVPPPKGKISLTIALSPNSAKPRLGRRTYTLRCRPAAGTLPHRASACTRLLRVQNPFAPVPRDQACTQIYGGPQQAVVTGIYGGKPVRTAFTRTDGCQIARWNRVRFLFPIATGIR